MFVPGRVRHYSLLKTSKHGTQAFIRLRIEGGDAVGRTTIASQFDEDSELLERFEEFEKETGYGNRSKAVRACMRRGLNQFEDEQESAERTYTAIEETLLTMASVIAVVVISLPLLFFSGLVGLPTVVTGMGAYLAVAAGIVLGVELRARRRASGSSAPGSGVSN